VSGLWSEEAVGIIGGEPKCCKSFLALDLAVSVAAGTPCLRRFAVPSPGRVLLYAAEDALHIVRRRLDGICTAAGFDLADLDVQVITAPSLRLDLDADRASLDETIVTLKPRLLVLDPFVRLHRIDENVSGEVAPLLAYLRDLQRRHGVAVIVVHHARKGAGNMRAGQALRGSSEFHAWGDSTLYLRREPALAKTPGDDRKPCPSNTVPLKLGKRKREAIKMLARCYIEKRGDAHRHTAMVRDPATVRPPPPQPVSESPAACPFIPSENHDSDDPCRLR
jgi:RecA-family ATPase